METIGIIGLGYVGLPLARYLSNHFKVVGFDTNTQRVVELQAGKDRNNELTEVELIHMSQNIHYTTDVHDLKLCSVFIVTVPTPVNENNLPNLNHLKSACEIVGTVLKKNDLVIFESTVYPGCTEEYCLPILVNRSGLHSSEFSIGYSPERINPGDKLHTIKTIKKLISGSNQEASERARKIYEKIFTAGVVETSSIKVAEMAKVIENVQRDLNIAMANEIAIICDLMDIDTHEVINSASTKWNYIRFIPGLVGGHCIGVDPYYLAYKSENLGYRPEIVLSARKMNNEMSNFVIKKLERHMQKLGLSYVNLNILILGFAFKENVSDIRNTKVYDLALGLMQQSHNVEIYDPVVDVENATQSYPSMNFLGEVRDQSYDVLIIAVNHKEFMNQPPDFFKKMINPKGVIYELQPFLPDNLNSLRL
jgi:UDP-N-acetyl-D-galactosamine dehydrogenase